MRLMRQMARLLQSRGACGLWIPGGAVLCALDAGHPLPCARYAEMRAA
jgi:hypothetical protein